jgi:hypothetical protein
MVWGEEASSDAVMLFSRKKRKRKREFSEKRPAAETRF